MKILLVHGIGRSDSDPEYYASWRTAVAAGFKKAGASEPEFVEFHYDHLFEKHDSGPGVYVGAVIELLSTAAVQAVTDPISNLVHGIFHPGARDLASIGDSVRWHAGMVAQFTAEDGLRKDLRDHLSDVLTKSQPDLIAAHSLGSLLTFDFLTNDARAVRFSGLEYLTFGSQINNPFVRARLWPGRIVMPKVATWYHLFNPQDRVLTAKIAMADETHFHPVVTKSAAGHSPVTFAGNPGYLDHPNTQEFVWNVLGKSRAAGRIRTKDFAILSRSLVKPRRRALLIGINDYPDPANRLEGCVNDVYLFSSVLQERGFDPEDIRVVLNERATANGIRERLQWLLEDAGDGMERVLFYSGHGAQLPGYNAAEVIDHVDECLCPYDFAWTKETAITDDDLYNLYSDLPFSARFFAIFDCCHAGGITRDGAHKARGIVPPDDIRHRMLRWNAREQMWEERNWPANAQLNNRYGGTANERREMMGGNGVTYRLGRGMRLRPCLSKTDSHRLAKQKRALYLPVLLEACGEGQLSYEYRHGAVSYGAFTFALSKTLRAEPGVTFQRLIERTAQSLRNLRYDQSPQLVAPSAVKNAIVPGDTPSAKAKKTKP